MNIKKLSKLIFIPAFVLPALAALLIVRCFSPRERESEKTELLVCILRESGLEEADFAPLIGEYIEAHPKLLINIETRSFEDLLNRGPDSPGGRAPGDILILDGRYLRDLIDDEALLPLEDHPRSGSPLDRWALPLNASIDLLFYNTDLLKEAGFDRPPGTRADYLRYARALRDKRGSAGVYGSALGLSPEDSRGVYRDILSWIWASGTLLVQDGKLKFSGRALNGTLDFFATLENERLLAPGSFEKNGGQRIG
jgi:multiple sugar transport system substrate-binding protein